MITPRGGDTGNGAIAVTPWHTAITPSPRSDRVCAAFPGTHSHDCVDRADPDLAVTDLAGAGCLDHGVDHLVHHRVVGDDLDADLGYEVDRVLSTPVDLGVALLPAVTLHLADRHAEHTDLFQCALDVLQHERLDDRCHQLHVRSALLRDTGGRVRRHLVPADGVLAQTGARAAADR